MTDVSPKFVFGRPEEDQSTQTITRVVGCDVLLTEFKDAMGKTKVALCFRPKKSRAVFLLQERISGTWVATRAVRWFTEAMNKYLDTHNMDEESTNDSIPQV